MLGGWCCWWQWLLTPPGALHWCFAPSALAVPRAILIPCISFHPCLAFVPFFLLQSQVPFQHFSQSQIHWQVDFFSLLVTLLSSCSHLDLPVLFIPFTSGSCVSVFDPWLKQLFCPWDGLVLIKPSINLLSPLLKLPLMLSLLSLQVKYWAWWPPRGILNAVSSVPPSPWGQQLGHIQDCGWDQQWHRGSEVRGTSLGWEEELPVGESQQGWSSSFWRGLGAGRSSQGWVVKGSLRHSFSAGKRVMQTGQQARAVFLTLLILGWLLVELFSKSDLPGESLSCGCCTPESVAAVTLIVVAYLIFIFLKIEFTCFFWDLGNKEKAHYFSPADEKCSVCLHPSFYKIVFYKAEREYQVHVGAVAQFSKTRFCPLFPVQMTSCAGHFEIFSLFLISTLTLWKEFSSIHWKKEITFV